MKTVLTIFCAVLLFVGCNKGAESTSTYSDADKAVQEAFERNSKTVLANLEGWQNENLDYSQYADDFYMMDTGFDAEKDSINLAEMKEGDKNFWAGYDFKMTNEPVLLPGVDPDTRKPDGSVRHYSEWEVTKAATDSTPAKSGTIFLYETFDFDENGKIRRQSVYGDFTGLMMYLNSDE